MRASNQTKSKNRGSAYELLRLVREEPAHQTKDIFAGQISQQAQRMRADIERVARRPFNILITGETGTGKTQIARQIHRLSVRASNPLIELNCANLPEHLVEAELFGHRKGAFTGADHDRKGLFEEADGGILFLDEIGDVPLTVQNRLLKVIDEKQIKRLGTNHYQFFDVQIVAATSRNLAKMIQEGEFREDLYCRLAVLTVEASPLRYRREDIPAIVDRFLMQVANSISESANRRDRFRIDKEALVLLCEFDYPGNIRSLRNLVYELTSYVEGMESISIELVEFALAKLRSQIGDHGTATSEVSKMSDPLGCNQPSIPSVGVVRSGEAYLFLHSIAREGDIVLPLELCVLRDGETFKQWTARAKRCSIDATRVATGGTIQTVAKRLGLTFGSLKGHLHRAKHTQNEALFDWQQESD